MNEQEKNARLEAYNRRTHTYGRIACGVTLVMLLGAPFAGKTKTAGNP